jgi:hypothetical protein
MCLACNNMHYQEIVIVLIMKAFTVLTVICITCIVICITRMYVLFFVLLGDGLILGE